MPVRNDAIDPKETSVGPFVEPLPTRIMGSLADRASRIRRSCHCMERCRLSKAAAPANEEDTMAKKAKKAKKAKRQKRPRRSRVLARAAIPPERICQRIY